MCWLSLRSRCQVVLAGFLSCLRCRLECCEPRVQDLDHLVEILLLALAPVRTEVPLPHAAHSIHSSRSGRANPITRPPASGVQRTARRRNYPSMISSSMSVLSEPSSRSVSDSCGPAFDSVAGFGEFWKAAFAVLEFILLPLLLVRAVVGVAVVGWQEGWRNQSAAHVRAHGCCDLEQRARQLPRGHCIICVFLVVVSSLFSCRKATVAWRGRNWIMLTL